ncbi:IS3 family transposase [Peptoniphilus sp.]|uniref:IS3 family transposase n=1 Tax=Peptoniphilus sp. TaxID=1971214 RepID=UPI0034578F76
MNSNAKNSLGQEFKNYKELINEIDKYVKKNNPGRIKEKIKGVNPIMFRIHSPLNNTKSFCV